MKKRMIVMITTTWFPEGDAGAIRLRTIGKILVESGFDVKVLCRGEYNVDGVCDGISYISLRSKRRTFIGKLLNYAEFPRKVKTFLKKNKNVLYGIYIYNAHDTLFSYCKEFCKCHNVRLFHDCVEWYSPEEYRLGRFDRWYRMKDRINRKIIDESFSVIAISNYLNDYFTSKNIRTIKVPILCDSKQRRKPKELKKDNTLVIFYGGLPGNKDLIENLLEATLLLTQSEREKIKIVLVGVSREYLIKVSGINRKLIDKCSGMLAISGRVSRQEVLQKMEEADFSFLARRADLRYAKAGFPSKVVEALANATPLLCNISSDLEDYLEDGYNAIISVDHTPEMICKAIRKALKLTPEQKLEMSKNALRTAEEKFDYRGYQSAITSFFEEGK